MTERVVGMIKAMVDGEYGFISTSAWPQRDVFFHRSTCESGLFDDLSGLDWVEFELHESKKGPDAREARLVSRFEASLEQRVERGRSRYTGAMAAGRNPGSLRLDGLTRVEAKNMEKRGLMSQRDFYAFMSEHGIRQVARQAGITFERGSRLALVEAIVESKRKSAMG